MMVFARRARHAQDMIVSRASIFSAAPDLQKIEGE
jgi:hypothetical protein